MSHKVPFPIQDPQVMMTGVIMKALQLYEDERERAAGDGPKLEKLRRLTLALQFDDGSSDADDDHTKIIIHFPNNPTDQNIHFFIAKKPQRVDFVQLALENDLILDKIFSHGSFEDLKNFRLVNRKWDGVAIRELSSKRRVFINIRERITDTLRTNRRLERPHRRTDRQVIAGSFVELATLIKGSRLGFPGNSVEISTHQWPLPNGSVNKLLKKQGDTIKYIKLNYGYNDQSLPALCKLLSNELSNVEEITVDFFSFLPRRNHQLDTISLDSFKASSLQKLAKIEFTSNPAYGKHTDESEGFFRAIIVEAPNLTSIINLPCKLIKAVLQGGNRIIVKNLRFGCYSTGEAFGCFEDLIASNIPLEFLSLPSESVPQGSRDIWARLLEAKKDSVRSLRVSSVTSPLEITTLTHLERLVLQLGQSALFPIGFKLSRKFPNLSTVTLMLDALVDIGNCFPEDDFGNNILDVSASAVRMNITQISLISLLYKKIPALLMKFPNISTLTLNCNQLFGMDRSVASPAYIWSFFSHVESVQLYNVWYHNLVAHELDSLIAGVHVEVCPNVLESFSSRSPTALDLDLLVTQPGIHNMENLKKLSIELKGSIRRGHAPLPQFITKVSAWCGWDWKPQLEVCFHYDDSELYSQELVQLLSPLLSPAVTIEGRVGSVIED